MKTMTEQLEAVLAAAGGERPLCAFLKSNPYLLIESLNYLGNPSRVISEFPLGTECYADFMVVAPFSGAIEVLLIEVEPPSMSLFNQDGTLSKRANKALEQVNSWNTYIRKNRQQFLRDLERYSKEKDLIREHPEDEKLTCTAGLDIHNSHISIYPNFGILMGRRSFLNEAMLEKKSEFKNNCDVSLMSCDRLFAGARKMDLSPDVYD